HQGRPRRGRRELPPGDPDHRVGPVPARKAPHPHLPAGRGRAGDRDARRQRPRRGGGARHDRAAQLTLRAPPGAREQSQRPSCRAPGESERSKAMPTKQVVDADGHVQEPEDLWANYLEPKYHEMAPRSVVDTLGRHRTLLAGELRPYIPSARAEGEPRRAGGHDPHARLADMDAEGMDVSVIYPSAGLAFGGIA